MLLKNPKVGKPKRYSFQELLTKFPDKLPHYKVKEVETLKRFITLNLLPGDYTFDFRLPYELTEAEKLMEESMQRMFINLKSMRIDAVVETEDNIWILEVAKGLELSYTGKLLGYTDLYREIFGAPKPLKMGVVARDDNPMARRALERMGVKIWIV